MKLNRIAAMVSGMVLCIAGMAASVRGAADLSTPKATAKSFYAAVAAGDAQGVRNCMLAEGDQQEQLATSMVDLIISGKKLGDAAKEKFGANAGKLEADTINKEDAARIDSAQETDSGDDAKLQVNPNSKALALHKTDGQWKIQVLDYAGGNMNNIADQITLLAALASTMNDTAADIAAGKYPTSPDAEASLRQRFSEVMVNHYKPATNPTTAPAVK